MNKTRQPPKQRKQWDQMTPAELREATKDLNSPRFRPHFFKPNPKQKSQVTHFMEKLSRRGRPRAGEGAQKLYISLERGLLRETDRFARQRGQSRSGVVAEALRLLMKERRRRAG